MLSVRKAKWLIKKFIAINSISTKLKLRSQLLVQDVLYWNTNFTMSVLVLVFKIKNITCLLLFPTDGYLTLKTKKKIFSCKLFYDITLQYYLFELCANQLDKGSKNGDSLGIMGRLWNNYGEQSCFRKLEESRITLIHCKHYMWFSLWATKELLKIICKDEAKQRWLWIDGLLNLTVCNLTCFKNYFIWMYKLYLVNKLIYSGSEFR